MTVLRPILAALYFMEPSLSFAQSNTLSETHRVEVFTVTDLPVVIVGIKETPCFLDEVQRFEEKITRKSQDREAISELAGEQEIALIKAFNCQYRASLYGIKRLPAIVIDQNYVAYGVDSVLQALAVLNDRDESYA